MSRWWIPRKDIVLDRSIKRSTGFVQAQPEVVGFSTPENGIDRPVEFPHAIVAFHSRAIEPLDSTIWSRDITISTNGDVNDDFPQNETRSSNQMGRLQQATDAPGWYLWLFSEDYFFSLACGQRFYFFVKWCSFVWVDVKQIWRNKS